MHSRDYRVEDSQFRGDMTIMIELLESLKGVSNTQARSVKQAIDSIKEVSLFSELSLSSPLFNVCLTCIFNELMYDWRYDWRYV